MTRFSTRGASKRRLPPTRSRASGSVEGQGAQSSHVLTQAGPLVSAIVTPNGFIQDMPEPTLVRNLWALGFGWEFTGPGWGPQQMFW